MGMKKPNSTLCDVSGNVISFQPSANFFGVGNNELQIRVINEDKSLISFKERVKCSDAMGFPDDDAENQKTIVEQILAKTGQEAGERKTADEKEKQERIEAINTEKAGRIAGDAREKSERQAEIATERARINQFTKLAAGSTTGDAELIDGRTDVDGEVHENIGDAMRGQARKLREDLVNGNVATNVTMPINRYDKNSVTVGGYISDGGSITEHSQFSYSDYIVIDKTKKYAIWTVFGIDFVGAFYDKNKQFLGLFYKSSISNGVIDFSSFSPLEFYNSIYFVRLNQTLGDMDGSMFIEDATSYPSDYIPYEKPKYEVVGNLSKAINELLESYGLEKGYILINETLSNIAIGKNAMKNATTDNGAFNVAIGDNAMMNNTGTGSDDTGNYNVAVGYKAMEKNTTGNHNTAVGFQAMPVNTTGTGNTAIGEDACLSNTIGNGNTGIGRYSLFSNQEGGDNTAIGIHSLRENIGQRNTAIGASAGRSNNGNNNIFIGYYSNSSPDVSNAICIGQENYCFESNMLAIGSGYLEKFIIYTKTGRKLISFNDDGTVTWSDYIQPTN